MNWALSIPLIRLLGKKIKIDFVNSFHWIFFFSSRMKVQTKFHYFSWMKALILNFASSRRFN